MANPPKRIYWDACTWIALIHKEKIRDENGKVAEDRENLCRAVISAAQMGSIEIVTSALSLVEVCKNPEVKEEGSDIIAAFFEHNFITLINLDLFTGERARELMLAGYSKLKPADATHLASAALADAEAFHTFDDRLLKLSGLIDKANASKLIICKPHDDAEPAPLLDRVPDLFADQTQSDSTFQRIEKSQALLLIAAALRKISNDRAEINSLQDREVTPPSPLELAEEVATK